MAYNFDSNLNIGGEQPLEDASESKFNFVRSLKHPFIVLAHVGFRAMALCVYLFAGISSNTYIAQFVTILTLLSIDFWVVKNITGRFLVGLRWWNFIDANGGNHWRFERTKNPERYDAMEGKIFWTALFITPIFWFLLTFTAFFTFKWLWMLVAMIAFAMSCTNLYGYLRCRWNSTKDAMNSLLRRAFLSRLFSTVVSGAETV